MKKVESHPEKSPTTGESQVARSSQKAPSLLCQPTRHHSPTWTHPDSPACCLHQSAKRRQSLLLSVLPAIPLQSLPGGAPQRETGHRGLLNITRSPDPSPDATSHLGGHEARGVAKGEAGNCRGNEPEDSPEDGGHGPGQARASARRGQEGARQGATSGGLVERGICRWHQEPICWGQRRGPKEQTPPEHTPAARTQSGASWARGSSLGHPPGASRGGGPALTGPMAEPCPPPGAQSRGGV